MPPGVFERGRRFRLVVWALAAAAVAAVAVAIATGLVAGGGVVVAGVLAAFAVIGLAVWLVPQWEAGRWERAGVDDKAELAKLTLDARTSLTQALGGLGLVATLALTAYQVNETRRTADRTLRLTERGQTAQRFAQAVELLGASNANGTPALDVRIGALYALRQIGIDSARDTTPALQVVAAYVANNHRRTKPPAAFLGPCSTPDLEKLRADVEAALTYVLPALSAAAAVRDTRRDGTLRTYWRLDSVDFSGMDLDGINLSRGSLNGVNFVRASLQNARFDEAVISGNMGQTCLLGASMRKARLFAHLMGASLLGTDLRGADLRESRIHPDALESAIVDDMTRLPS